MSKPKGHIKEWIEDYLGVPFEKAGLSDEDVRKLLECRESGKDPTAVHLTSTTLCACNICRS